MGSALLWTAAALATAVAVAWFYLVACRGRFWCMDQRLDVRPLERSTIASWPSVAVVMPARNEAPLLPQSLPSVLKQSYPGPFHAFMVDDHSEDGSGELAATIARETFPGRFTLLRSEPLPPGWTGKLWALQQGLETASRTGAVFVLLTDADVVHAPDTVASLVGKAVRHDLDAVSLMPRLLVTSLWERLLMPAFVYFFALIYPFCWVNDPRKSTAAAVGMCILLRREALERAGGLQPISSQLIDDCALGRLIKSRGRAGGGRIWLGLTSALHCLRSHQRLKSIWDMVARTAYVQLDYSPLWLTGTVLGLLLAFWVPPLSAVGGLVGVARDVDSWPLWWTALAGLASWSAMVASYLPTMRWADVPRRWAPLLPVTALLYTAMMVDSAIRFWRGRGGGWKGRTYRLSHPHGRL